MQKSDLKYVVVEGPIGVGKTTLANKLALDWDAELVLENVEDNPFLLQFYEEPRQFALSTQLHFLLTRTRQIQHIKQQSIFSNTRVSDFMAHKEKLFAQITLNSEEYDLYDQIYSYLTSDLPKPDLIIYLQASTKTLEKRVKNRARGYEKHINFSYLEKINSSYANFFHKYDSSPLLIINTENVDFVNNNEDYLDIINMIYKMEKGKHYFNPIPTIVNE